MAYYKNICLVEAPQTIVTPFPRFISDCVGVCYLAAAVEDIVEYMAMPENYYNERIFESCEQLLKSRSFDLAAISSMTGGFNNAVKLTRIARKHGVTVVMGGFHPTTLPEEALDVAWYEQKAVTVLLVLLYLGVKGIRLGPTLPEFLTPNVAAAIVEKFDLKGISTVEADVEAMMLWETDWELIELSDHRSCSGRFAGAAFFMSFSRHFLPYDFQPSPVADFQALATPVHSSRSANVVSVSVAGSS